MIFFHFEENVPKNKIYHKFPFFEKQSKKINMLKITKIAYNM